MELHHLFERSRRYIKKTEMSQLVITFFVFFAYYVTRQNPKTQNAYYNNSKNNILEKRQSNTILAGNGQ